MSTSETDWVVLVQFRAWAVMVTGVPALTLDGLAVTAIAMI